MKPDNQSWRGDHLHKAQAEECLIVLVYCILLLFNCMIFVLSPSPTWYTLYLLWHNIAYLC